MVEIEPEGMVGMSEKEAFHYWYESVQYEKGRKMEKNNIAKGVVVFLTGVIGTAVCGDWLPVLFLSTAGVCMIISEIKQKINGGI